MILKSVYERPVIVYSIRWESILVDFDRFSRFFTFDIYLKLNKNIKLDLETRKCPKLGYWTKKL